MKITDIIRSILDIVDGAQAPAEPVVAIKITAEPEADLMDMQRLAGLLAYWQTQNTQMNPIQLLLQWVLLSQQATMYTMQKIQRILEPMLPACSQDFKLPNKEKQ
jgi:hypothetical protein